MIDESEASELAVAAMYGVTYELPALTMVSMDSTKTDASKDLVWYASYGSNMSSARFLCYVQGGTPKGSARTYKGAENKEPPKDSMSLIVPHQLYFAGESAVWGGAPAFIAATPSSAKTYARAYLLTRDQFNDVVAQENNHEKLDYVSQTDYQALAPGYQKNPWSRPLRTPHLYWLCRRLSSSHLHLTIWRPVRGTPTSCRLSRNAHSGSKRGPRP